MKKPQPKPDTKLDLDTAEGEDSRADAGAPATPVTGTDSGDDTRNRGRDSGDDNGASAFLSPGLPRTHAVDLLTAAEEKIGRMRLAMEKGVHSGQRFSLDAMDAAVGTLGEVETALSNLRTALEG